MARAGMDASVEFNVVEATIDEQRRALDSGLLTSVELVIMYLIRIGTYDVKAGLNAFTMINPAVLEEAQASDDRRVAGLPSRSLEGIPYTLKDSFAYAGLPVTNGSPALEGLQSGSDSFVASKLRAAGAVLLGKTNMPPMAAGGMQRGLYGRAESPYNPEYLTAAFSSGSSNGAGSSTAASLAAFGIGSETVSSGRSPASNNGLVAYTPSRGIISCRGLWPLYVTCDVVVPYARSIKDLLLIRDVLAVPDETSGDFWRDQPHVALPPLSQSNHLQTIQGASLAGKRIAVPKMYVGQMEGASNAKVPYTSPAMIELWESARKDLEELGASVIYTDFPLVTNYEDDSISHEANNVAGAPEGWNKVERGFLIAKAWDDFLKVNNDSRLSDLSKIEPQLIFPKPDNYIPDMFLEHKNVIPYANLPALAQEYHNTSIHDLPGMREALMALEKQRERDFEAWMDDNNYDMVAFPAVGDVGKADLEFNVESAKHALQNGVRYSHGNRALRHLGVPTVNIPMGLLRGSGMPANLTFAGKAYADTKLLQYGYAYEQKSQKRVPPQLTPPLHTDQVSMTLDSGKRLASRKRPTLSASATFQDTSRKTFLIRGHLSPSDEASTVQVFANGFLSAPVSAKNGEWEEVIHDVPAKKPTLSYNLQPLQEPQVSVLIIALHRGVCQAAKLLWVSPET